MNESLSFLSTFLPSTFRIYPLVVRNSISCYIFSYCKLITSKREKMSGWGEEVKSARQALYFRTFSTIFQKKKTFQYSKSHHLFHRFPFGFSMKSGKQVSFFFHQSIAGPFAGFLSKVMNKFRLSSTPHRSIFGFPVPSDEQIFFESTPVFEVRIDKIPTILIRQFLFLTLFSFQY